MGAIRKKLLDYYFRIAYESYYLQLDLKQAYKYRLLHFLCIKDGRLPGDVLGVNQYLSIALEPDFIKWLDLNNDTKEILSKYNKDQSSIIHQRKNRISDIGNVLVVGPLCDISNTDLSFFDTLVFMKQPPEELLLNNHRVIVILNFRWIIQKKHQLLKWVFNNPKAIILSPRDLNSVIEKDSSFDQIPTFIMGASLMGLQRALFLLNYKYIWQSIDINGFNFSLSEEPYLGWYPSLISTFNEDKNTVLIKSNCKHDLVLNILFVRMLVKLEKNINGLAVELSQSNIGVLLEKFSLYRSN